MRKFALITGASRGIGLAFAELLARQGYDLLLVARSQDQLLSVKKRLQNSFNVEVVIFLVDLSLPSSPQELVNFIDNNKIEIGMVINNAAFGYNGKYSNLAWEQEIKMINLNIVSSVYITKYFLNKMLKSNSGSIINVISTVAFAPGPYMSSYSASKAYMLSYTESLAEEIKGSEVKLMALCPGPTRTNFHYQSGINFSEAELNQMPTAEQVAVYAYSLLRKNQVVVIHGWANKILVISLRFLPRNLIKSVLSIIRMKRLNLSCRKRQK